MKYKRIVLRIIVVILLAILLIPIPMIYKDGGTRTYTSILYKVIIWHAMDNSDDGYKTGTKVYLFPNNFHDLEYYK